MKGMTCREFDEIVHGFVRMELLDVKVREAALEHAAQCELCSQRMADAAALADASEMMRKNATGGAPAHVESVLLVAFRSHHRRGSWRRTLEWVTVGAAAAIVLIFLWTGSGRLKGRTSAPAPKRDVTTESGVPLDAKASGVAIPSEASPAGDTTVSDVSANETYIASDFVPVPYTGAISPDDPGMIVRVQLTRSSLAQLGYPVAETPDEDLILADVLVGEDGWPRGVKLIQ